MPRRAESAPLPSGGAAVIPHCLFPDPSIFLSLFTPVHPPRRRGVNAVTHPGEDPDRAKRLGHGTTNPFLRGRDCHSCHALPPHSQPLQASFPPSIRILASSLPGPVEERDSAGFHARRAPQSRRLSPHSPVRPPRPSSPRRSRRGQPGSPRRRGSAGRRRLLPVPFLTLCSPLSFSLSPAAGGAARAGKAGWWCYPWFWDSQSKMTLPIFPTCNPLGRSRTRRTLRGTRGMSEDEASPAGGGDEGLTQGGGGGGGGGWPRGARRLERHRVAQRAPGRLSSPRHRHPRFCLWSSGTESTPIPSSSLLPPSSPSCPSRPWLHAGGGGVWKGRGDTLRDRGTRGASPK